MTTGEILGKTYSINGKPEDISDFSPDLSADVYYEVVRLQGGKILFLDDHLERFEHTLSGSGVDYPGDHMIYENLGTLLRNNDSTVGNIRICLQKNEDETTELYCYLVPYIYPEECMYLSGVQLVTYSHERPNPGIKKWDGNFRISVHEHIRNFGVYEAILVNGRGEITEGSRSNVFFIDSSDRLITPPVKDVLPGITRKYVIRICGEQGIEVMERPVIKNELDDLISCFISGTSPKILPVWQLDGYQFRVDHPLLKLVMERFEKLLSDSLKTII